VEIINYFACRLELACKNTYLIVFIDSWLVKNVKLIYNQA